MLTKISKYKFVIACLIIMIISIFVLYISKVYIENKIILDLINSISISIITTCIISSILNFYSKNYFENAYENLIKSIPILDMYMQVGLQQFGNKFPIEDYKLSFINSNKTVLVFNDGKSFVTTNIELLKKRLEQKGKLTQFIFMNPNATDSMSVLSRKNNHVPDYYPKKIKAFIQYLNTDFIQKYPDHKIEIYVHNFFTTTSIVLMDDYAMLATYRLCSGYAEVPHFTFKKNQSEHNEYKKIEIDITNLIEKSTKYKIEN